MVYPAPSPAGSGATPRPPGLTVAAVARRLGVAPATLRTWARRYGLGPSTHVAGAHRRYSPEDLARLDLMRRMVSSGVGPGDAARAARAASAELLAPQGAARWSRPAAPEPAGGADPGRPPDGYDPPARAGTSLAIPGATPEARGLARAAMAMDGAACVDVIAQTLRARGAVWTWDQLLVPVLTAVGNRWETTGEGIEVEHLVSGSVVAVLSSALRHHRDHDEARPVLLACADEEQHSLPLLAVAAALGEQQVATRVLGARVPQRALAAAVRRTGPAAVLVWSQQHGTGDLAALADLTALRPAPLLVAAGPGWHGQAPEQVQPGHDLTDVLDRIIAAVA